MNLIASADKNWGIGCGSQLLARIPDDMQFFRKMTTGRIVVMGRKTWESLPDGALPDRVNIVLSQDAHYQAGGALVVHSLEELRRELEKYHTDDIFIIGGGSVYRQLLDACAAAYITKIDAASPADTWFPNLDERREWKLTARSGQQTYMGMTYHFCRYERMAGL